VKTIQQDLAAQLTRATEWRAEKEQLVAAQQQAAQEAAAMASQPVLLPPPQVAEAPNPPTIQSKDFHFPYEYHEIKAFKANYIAELKAELRNL
jgi:hypothetical protein